MKIKFAVAITPQGNYKVFGHNKLSKQEVKDIASDCLPEGTVVREVEIDSEFTQYVCWDNERLPIVN